MFSVIHHAPEGQIGATRRPDQSASAMERYRRIVIQQESGNIVYHAKIQAVTALNDFAKLALCRLSEEMKEGALKSVMWRSSNASLLPSCVLLQCCINTNLLACNDADQRIDRATRVSWQSRRS